MRLVLILTVVFERIDGWRIEKPWTNKSWCASVSQPNWPLSYSKYVGQKWERKARGYDSYQDERHECTVWGVQSKCHRCEKMECEGLPCYYQLQGVDPEKISKNIPSASDSPWAVNGSHRFDYGGASTTHVCLILSGGNCTSPLADVSMRDCSVRCWGWNEKNYSTITQFPEAKTITSNTNDDNVAVWEYKRRATAQGQVTTLVGGEERGFVDGFLSGARFNQPRGVALDAFGNFAFVTDFANHAIRAVNLATGGVVTIAGAVPGSQDASKPGCVDGIGNEARFSFPVGIAASYEPFSSWGELDNLVLYVADSGNHRIRKISGTFSSYNVTVECFAGRCGNGTLARTPSKSFAQPEPGLADGWPDRSRFDAPRGIAIHPASGDVIVADTNNHLIRLVNASGFTFTIAGQVEPANDEPNCLPPCLRGVPGYNDGNASRAQFSYPLAVAIDQVSSTKFNKTNGRYTVLVADGHRVRRLIPADGYWHSRYAFDGGIVSEGGQVVTLAGTADPGDADGAGPDAKFDRPAGLVVADDGHAYTADTASCRLRRISSPKLSVAKIESNRGAVCDARLVDLIRPAGCAMYDRPVDSDDMMLTTSAGHLRYPSANIPNCIGSPAPDRGQSRRDWHSGENLVVYDQSFDEIDEDTAQGTILQFSCPAGCLSSSQNVVGAIDTGYFADISPLCATAVLYGAIDNSTGGLITIEMLHGTVARSLSNHSFNTPGSGTLNHTIAPLSSIYGTAPQGALLVERLFAVKPLPESSAFQVQTIAGKPASPLETRCGYHDTYPPQAAAFDAPTGIALQRGRAKYNQTLIIADTGNHAIRGLTAVCSSPCENGGVCVGPELCACAEGWRGTDCTSPVCSDETAVLLSYPTILCVDMAERTLCVAPELCSCAPGWSGPDCSTPLCVQECLHDGVCVAPDTCFCSHGWFDANCSTPVCNQTCGNGGNCTAPGLCACPSDWTGADCREPVCQQKCLNGGQCVAPDTCQCPPQWHGHDCGLPVCHQGYFVPFQGDAFDAISDDNDDDGPEDVSLRPPLPVGRTHHWPTYRPCYFEAWCNATNGFDCGQARRLGIPIEVPSGAQNRAITGRSSRPNRCDWIEIRKDAYSQFAYALEINGTTDHARYTPLTPYGWNATGHPWRAYSGPADGGPSRSRPWNHAVDRQVAAVEWHNVTQGVYVCANHGNCTAPDVCRCAPGWIGFDCRTPVCSQGYYDEDQDSFVSGTEDTNEITYFENFMDPNMTDYRLTWPYSNPDYTFVEEYFDGYDKIVRSAVTQSGGRYLTKSASFQGGYRCSIRANTRWENPDAVFDHVNFYSLYMDAERQADGNQYTFWENMNWQPTHSKSKKLELLHELPTGNIMYVYTNEGHRRDGVWRATGEPWEKGSCVIEFKRTCEASFDAIDAETLGVPMSLATEQFESIAQDKRLAFVQAPSYAGDPWSLRLDHVAVQDTDFAYRPRIYYDDFRAYGHGVWSTMGGECVDTVLRGCKNNGTCVAPDTCECPQGWTGSDCSVPICSQTCLHHGNCTSPDTCTCEAGWDGFDCSVPLCAQECYHGGECVAPDTCRCVQWESEWPSGHEVPRPMFRLPNGDPQLTGWTGFDCSVPICTQAKKFTKNVAPADEIRAEMRDALLSAGSSSHIPARSYSPLDYVELGGRGYDGREDIITDDGERLLKCDNKPRCPSYDQMVVSNVGESFPEGCGFDVLYTGCCERIYDDADDDVKAAIDADPTDKEYANVGTYFCQYCPTENQVVSDNNFTCIGANMADGAENSFPATAGTYEYEDVPSFYSHGRLETQQIRICGKTNEQMNYIETFSLRPNYENGKNDDPRTNVTSYLFLCRVTEWVQGDYIDDAGLCTGDEECSAAAGTGIEYGSDDALAVFDKGRHVRINTPNITRIDGGYGEDDLWQYGEIVRGEGIYECNNGGTCIAPDVCTCKDGWDGFDCSTPLCRHLQTATGVVAGCENGGICGDKDTCTCIQVPSVLKETYEKAPGGVTGWTGTDCTMPMCVQGMFDPFCTDLPQAPGGEGCYRCANGGNCTAPDTCTCAQGWTGYDCRTPVCEVIATPLQRRQLDTFDENKIDVFEKNPCSLIGIYDLEAVPSEYSGEGEGGYLAPRGNCTAPNECTCWCKRSFSERICERKKAKRKSSKACKGPFQDILGSPLSTGMDLVNYRNLLAPNEIFGTRSCQRGYEGTVSEKYDRYTSCHLRIFTPTVLETWTITLTICSSVLGIVILVMYVYIRRRMKQKYLQAKIERRRTRRSSEEGSGGGRDSKFVGEEGVQLLPKSR